MRPVSRLLCALLSLLLLLSLTACARPLSADTISATRDRAMRSTVGFDYYIDANGILRIDPKQTVNPEYAALDGASDIAAAVNVPCWYGTCFVRKDRTPVFPKTLEMQQQAAKGDWMSQFRIDARTTLIDAWRGKSIQYIGNSSTDLTVPWMLTSDGVLYANTEQIADSVAYVNGSAVIHRDGTVKYMRSANQWAAPEPSSDWKNIVQVADLFQSGTLIGLTADGALVQYIYDADAYPRTPVCDLSGTFTELLPDTGFGNTLFARCPDGTLKNVFAASEDAVPQFSEKTPYDQLIFNVDTGFWLAVTPDGTVEYLPAAGASEAAIAADKASCAWILSRTDVQRLHN